MSVCLETVFCMNAGFRPFSYHHRSTEKEEKGKLYISPPAIDDNNQNVQRKPKEIHHRRALVIRYHLDS